jgi:DNA-binding NtrC family response regulator
MPESALALVADDDPVTRRLLVHHLQAAGYQLREAADGKAAQAALDDDVDVALFDLQMPGASGLECLRYAREHFPDVQVLVISGQGEIRDAVAAMKQGACEYISKPFDPDELLAHVAQAVRTARLSREHRTLKGTVGAPAVRPNWIARTPESRELYAAVERMAALDATVLITGESGTGKTTIARIIHQTGPRRDHPFVAVSCAALPRDLIEAELFGHERGAFTGAVTARAGQAELADGGTLFLDEIGDLPLELQPKLLTFLQDHTISRIGGAKARKVDVRVIAATNQNLEAMCEQRLFRQDLYYRLNVLPMHVPPLAARRPEIREMVTQILLRIARQRGQTSPAAIDADAMTALENYSWPGNIRELENMLERATAFCEANRIKLADLRFPSGSASSPKPATAPAGGPPPLAGMTLVELEKRAVADALAACHGNRALAARMLGISERSIYNKLKQYGLENGG